MVVTATLLLLSLVTHEAVLSRSLAGDHTPYRWLARAVSSEARLVVDLACGSGPMSRELARTGRTVVGLDVSADELSLAAERGPGPWLRADALRLPFADGSVDAVTSSMGLVVVQPLTEVLAEIARVLKPGGVLAAIAPAARPLAARDLRVLSRVSYKNVGAYLTVRGGVNQVWVMPAGQVTPRLIDTRVTLEAGRSYTVAAVGLAKDVQARLFLDEIATPPEGSANVRLVHASPDAPPVDAVVPGEQPLLLRNNLKFGEATPYVAIPAPLRGNVISTRFASGRSANWFFRVAASAAVDDASALGSKVRNPWPIPW